MQFFYKILVTMKIFLQCGIVEHSEHGVPIVVREYWEEAYKFSEKYDYCNNTFL